MKSQQKSRSALIYLSIFLFALPVVCVSPQVQAAPLKNIPVTVTQPDGQVLHLYASGDEFINWLHDEHGYVIMRDPVSGYYVYTLDDHGTAVPSPYPVGTVQADTVGAKQGMPLSPDKAQEKLQQYENLFPSSSPTRPDLLQNAPKTGIINNLVVFIRFNNDTEYTQNISYYQNMFNNGTPGTNSMYNYYYEVSYGALNITSTFYYNTSTTVISYKDGHNRSYYLPYDASFNTNGYQNETERTLREHTLLRDALYAVAPQIPASANLDGDGDGYVDNVCFIVRGEVSGWNSLLWPHRWSLFTHDVMIYGKHVSTYNFQMETALDTSGVGVLCHEMFHSLGAPDLYHYSADGLHPVFQWELMEYNLNPPQHMSAYMKMRYGTWIAGIPKITTSGTYTLNPLTSSYNNAYRIDSPNSSSEYFIVEYRRRTGVFESSLPGEGLLVYRVNTAQDGSGNRNGPPDELYVYRPYSYGNPSANGDPSLAAFSSDVGRTAINDATEPSSFLSDGGRGGLNISNVTGIGDTISFSVNIGASGKPNLRPYKPSGWANKIVLSHYRGAKTDSKPLYYGVQAYASWAVANGGAADITKKFYVKLYVDGVRKGTWYSRSLSKGYFTYMLGCPIGRLSPGSHQITIVADTANNLAESKETDNTYTRIIWTR
jgi:M6 family metalloprotease-like protein